MPDSEYRAGLLLRHFTLTKSFPERATFGEWAMKACRKFLVRGHVQGVWFRASTRQEAEKLGITGYAINLSDGSVEVLACGDTEMLDRLAAWLHQGPSMAEVKSVISSEYEGECPAGFSTG